MSGKKWDFEMGEPAEKRRQKLLVRSREHDLHIPLSEDVAHAREHEALQRSADILCLAVQDFVEGQVKVLRREGHVEEEVLDVMEEDFRHHVERIAAILVREAVARLK